MMLLLPGFQPRCAKVVHHSYQRIHTQESMYDVNDVNIRYESVHQPTSRRHRRRRRRRHFLRAAISSFSSTTSSSSCHQRFRKDPLRPLCQLCKGRMPSKGRHLCIAIWAATGEWHLFCGHQGYESASVHKTQWGTSTVANPQVC